MSDVTKVPYIGAIAPNCSVTGFQISVRQKAETKCAKGLVAAVDQRDDDRAQKQEHTDRGQLRCHSESKVAAAQSLENR